MLKDGEFPGQNFFKFRDKIEVLCKINFLYATLLNLGLMLGMKMVGLMRKMMELVTWYDVMGILRTQSDCRPSFYNC